MASAGDSNITNDDIPNSASDAEQHQQQPIGVPNPQRSGRWGSVGSDDDDDENEHDEADAATRTYSSRKRARKGVHVGVDVADLLGDDVHEHVHRSPRTNADHKAAAPGTPAVTGILKRHRAGNVSVRKKVHWPDEDDAQQGDEGFRIAGPPRQVRSFTIIYV